MRQRPTTRSAPLFISIVCALILAQFIALAQHPSTAVGQLKIYRVEIVVFYNRGPDSSAGEIWDRITPKYASSVDGLVNTNDNLSRVRRHVQYIELRHLSSIVQKLENEPQYDVLDTSAWAQPLFKKSNSIHVPLGGRVVRHTTSSSSRPEFSGFLQLFDNRLLFVDLNLNVRTARRSAGNFSNQPRSVYSLREKRRVKLNEVHYFDHPYFGAIVRVSRLSG